MNCWFFFNRDLFSRDPFLSTWLTPPPPHVILHAIRKFSVRFVFFLNAHSRDSFLFLNMNHFSRLSFAISTILIFPRDLIFFFTPSFTLSIRTFAHGADKVIRFFFWTWIVCFTCDFFLHDSLISTTNLYLRCSSHYSFVVHVISFVTCDPPPHTHTRDSFLFLKTIHFSHDSSQDSFFTCDFFSFTSFTRRHSEMSPARVFHVLFTHYSYVILDSSF